MMQTTPTTETRAAFARRIGINKSNVTRAAQAGRIVLTANGKRVEVEASLARWAETRGGRDDVAARHAETRGAEVSMGQPPVENATAGESSAPPSDGRGRTEYKAMVLHYENSNIKMEMALRRGLRYPRDLVKREAASLGGTTRAALERIVDQLAPRLAVMTNDLERRRLIDAELRRLRWLIKGELPRSLRRMRQAAKVGAGGTVA